jgi:hypothetical protein
MRTLPPWQASSEETGPRSRISALA